MLLIPDFLGPEDVARILEGLAELPLEEGARTARGAARQVKRNRQARTEGPRGEALKGFVRAALLRSPLITAFAQPARFGPILFSRSGIGDGYGLHIDEPFMGEPPIRTDLSFTIFLSAPESYGGGSLTLSESAGEQPVRLPAGGIVVYRSTTLHQVEPVTFGERVVAAGWIQSRVRDAGMRDILFDLANVRASLANGPVSLLLDKARANLLRQVAEA